MGARVVHSTLASVTAAAALALLVAALVAQVRGSASAIRLVLLVRRVALVATLLAVAVGLALYAGGHRPKAGLHLLYGFFALATVPLAASLAARTPRRGALFHLGGAVLLLGLCLRLATTG